MACALALVLLGMSGLGIVAISSPDMIALAVVGAHGANGAPLIRGYPLVLSSGAGGVWYGGTTASGVESADRVDYITPAGEFEDFPFTGELAEHSPGYFAHGLNGEEWFLAYPTGGGPPLLAAVSPSGSMSVHSLALPPGSRVRGLAFGSDGDLWMTDTRVEHLTRMSAILRVSPAGAITAFSNGLRAGAIPTNITAGSGSTLWFTDTAGRIGRIDTNGLIKEFPIHGAQTGSPAGPIVASGGDLWFILDATRIGRMTPSGRVSIFRPMPTYVQTADKNETVALSSLVAGPDGEVWFTRNSGEVARIDQRGHATTVTDRLEAAYGIAFGSGGEAWIGEGPAYELERGTTPIPARVARISASGELVQYPQPERCRVPRVLGDGPSLAAVEIRGARCEVAGIRRSVHSTSNRLVVIAQSLRPGTIVSYKTSISLTLGHKPPVPKQCRATRFVHVIANAREMTLWENPLQELDNEYSHGEGPQTYFACVPPEGRKLLVFTEENDLEAYNVINVLHVAGHFLAIASVSADHYNNGAYELTLFNVQRARRTFTAGYRFAEESHPARPGASAIDTHGDIAWVVEALAKGAVTRETLMVHYAHGTRAIESGADIADIALDEHRLLTWQAGGQRRSLSLGDLDPSRRQRSVDVPHRQS